MKKISLLILFILLTSILAISTCLAGNVNLTTYYPSPHGAYDQVRLVPRASLALAVPCNIGTIYVEDTNNTFQYCEENGAVGAWTSFEGTLWERNDANGWIYPINISDNVGINLNNPSTELEINGTTTTDDLITTNIVVDNIELSGNFTTLLAGRIAMNATTGDITVSGDITAADITANAYYYTSDEKFKKDIALISSPIEKAMALKGVSFKWKDSDKLSMGFIAQDVEQVLPELVGTNKNGEKSVQYGNITALLIETVKTQQLQMNQFQNQINALKNEINNLKVK